MSTEDPHYSVRTSAFKCLQQMTKVEDFWKYIMKRNDFYVSKLLIILAVTFKQYLSETNIFLIHMNTTF